MAWTGDAEDRAEVTVVVGGGRGDGDSRAGGGYREVDRSCRRVSSGFVQSSFFLFFSATEGASECKSHGEPRDTDRPLDLLLQHSHNPRRGQVCLSTGPLGSKPEHQDVIQEQQ